MKTIFKSVLAACALLAAQAAHADAIYYYSYTFADGGKVSGSFTGEANGNLITNLSNITASVDGVEFAGSGHLYAASLLNGTKWVPDTGVASFDGRENNFLFIDVNYPLELNYSNFFYAIRGGSDPTVRAVAYFGSKVGHDTAYEYDAAGWSLTEASTNDVPEPVSVALFGAGLAGLGFASRARKNSAA
jgi:hypothetical protein